MCELEVALDFVDPKLQSDIDASLINLPAHSTICEGHGGINFNHINVCTLVSSVNRSECLERRALSLVTTGASETDSA